MSPETTETPSVTPVYDLEDLLEKVKDLQKTMEQFAEFERDSEEAKKWFAEQLKAWIVSRGPESILATVLQGMPVPPDLPDPLILGPKQVYKPFLGRCVPEKETP